jgi:hypothetical protein
MKGELQMPKGTITIQVDYEGKFIYAEIDGKKYTEPVGIADNPPPGVIKGIIDIGHILHFEQPDRKRRCCFHLPNCRYVG